MSSQQCVWAGRTIRQTSGDEVTLVRVAEKAHVYVSAEPERFTYTVESERLGRMAASEAEVWVVGSPVAWMMVGIGPHEGNRLLRLTPPAKYNPKWWRVVPLFGAMGD